MSNQRTACAATTISLQEAAAPDSVCFGCGQASEHGLRIKSYPDADGIHLVATVTPDERYCGWPGLVYGGYLAMLADCHSNWTAMAAHYRAEGRVPGSLPKINCATAQLQLHYMKPTPMGVPLYLRARVEGPVRLRTRVICEIYAENKRTVMAESVFARINPSALARKAHAESA